VKRLSLYLVPFVLVAGLSFFVGCSKNNNSTPTGPSGPTTFETMAAWGDSILNTTKNITAEQLWTEMNDADTTQPYIISVRSLADDTVRGHIPGAHHWDVADLINHRDELPVDKKIVVYCYTGQTASFSTSYLNLIGLNAYNLKWGFCSWTSDTAQTGGGGGWYTLTPGGQALETTNNPMTTEYDFPSPTVSGGTAIDMFVNRISLQLTASPTNWKMKTAADVYANLNDGDPSNDWFLLCYWPEANYNAGHVPGSFRFQPGSLGVSENLKYIPTDRPVIVYCFTGQTSMQMDAYLNALGYDAYSMRYGMNAITDDAGILGSNVWTDLTPSYPVATGAITIRG
jgi:rhodanese-related sulfurtransferase